MSANPAVLFTVMCVAALAVVLTFAVARSVTNPLKRQAFDMALHYIASDELEDVDTALNKSVETKRGWNDYWLDLVRRSGRSVDDPAKPGRAAVVIAAVSLMFGLFVIGPPLGLLIPVVVLLLGKTVLGAEATKRIATTDQQLPVLLSALTAALSTGGTIVQALQDVADDIPQPLGDDIRLLRQDLSLNVPPDKAIAALVDRVPSREMKFLGASMGVALQSGENLGPQLEIISEVVSQRTRIRQKLRSAVSQVKPTAYLAYLAVPAMFLNSLRAPENRVYWLGGGQGFVLMVVVGLLYLGGIFVIRLMVRSVEKM